MRVLYRFQHLQQINITHSWLRPGGVIDYHSALELHGYAYTAWQGWARVIAPREPGAYEAGIGKLGQVDLLKQNATALDCHSTKNLRNIILSISLE